MIFRATFLLTTCDAVKLCPCGDVCDWLDFGNWAGHGKLRTNGVCAPHLTPKVNRLVLILSDQKKKIRRLCYLLVTFRSLSAICSWRTVLLLTSFSCG